MTARTIAATVTRSFALDDIRRSRTGDGRTVEAYAAVFDSPSEITDRDGHYLEQIHRTAFNRTLSHRGTAFGVFYNHGKTLYGTASDRASVPLGTPVEVRADNRGLLTVTRYNKTPLADDVLEAIDNGDIRGQSFTGRILRSTPERGPFRSRNGELTLVTRHEVGLIEYGPTPFPAYEDAEIVGRRSLGLGEGDELLEIILRNLDDAAVDAVAGALTDDDDREHARAVLSEVLGKIGSDTEGDDRPAYVTRLQALADRLDTPSGTPDPGLASADAVDNDDHSAPKPTSAQIRARLYRIGVL